MSVPVNTYQQLQQQSQPWVNAYGRQQQSLQMPNYYPGQQQQGQLQMPNYYPPQPPQPDNFNQFGQMNGWGGAPGGQVHQAPQVPPPPEAEDQNFPVNAPPRPVGQYANTGPNNILQAIALGNLGSFFAAPQQLVNNINNGWDQFRSGLTAYNDRLAWQQARRDDNRIRRQALRSITDLMGGGRGGRGSGGGFANSIRDTNSSLAIGPGGQVTTNITAQNLPPWMLQMADDRVRNWNGRAPTTRPTSRRAQGELNQLLRSRIAQIAPNVERELINQNSPLGRAIEQARSQQFRGLAGMSNALESDEINRQANQIRNIMRVVA